MFRHLVPLAAAAAVLAIAAPAAAKDRNGYRAIAAQDFGRAERRLAAERRIFPNKPELLINLASVYRNTGRAAEARAMYDAVLAREPVTLATPSGGDASSHDLARRGLATLGATDIAAR